MLRALRDGAHRAHERLVELIEVGAGQEAEALWRRHLRAGTARLMAHVSEAVLDLME